MKKRLLTVGASIIGVAILPLVSISATSNEKSTKKITNIAKPFITKPRNIRDFEKQIKELKNKNNNNEWQPTYITKKWKNIFDAKLNFEYAKKYGWNSLEKYATYLQYVYETNYGKINNQFGYFNKDNANWVAWHLKSGMVLGKSYIDGITSPTRPTWTGAEKVKANHIKNDMDWYAYDQGSMFFIFNKDHIADAWKRLIYSKRLIPVSYSNIKHTANKEGVHPKYFMVNGQLINGNDLNKYKNYYYVTTDGDSDYVVDSNNWKILVTDDKKDIVISGNLNPDTYTPMTYPVIPFTNEYKMTEYPMDYIENDNFKDPNPPKTEERGGKYQITYKYSKFSDMMTDENIVLPQEYIAQYGLRNKYNSYLGSTPFSHHWAGGGYMFIWVEDGKGGHKIYKSLESLNKKVRLANNGKFLMYGNWHHAFPANGKKWFEDIAEIYNDSHIK